MTPEEIIAYDNAHVWHPYASATDKNPVYPVKSAEGCMIELMDGTKLVDGMSSWWCAIHGYNHPALNKAAINQLSKMSHVMFGGLTHEPAVSLVKRLVSVTPKQLTNVFLCDSGSVSVEVAMKMALQYARASGKPNRNRFLTIRGGYHGDTFGAMSVCDPITGMHHIFSENLPQHLFAPKPNPAFGQPCFDSDVSEISNILHQQRDSIAAVILEPIVQGAGGMWFYSSMWLQRVRKLCDEHEIILILDEIVTGFGRTGKMFACEHANICPDHRCSGIF